MKQIKILIIDQMGVLASERRKYYELANYKDLQITALVPKKWKLNFHLVKFEKNPANQYNTVALPVAYPGYGHRSFFLNSLGKTFSVLQPDIIHLFQEPYSIFAAQTILAKKLFCPNAIIIFVTWQNLYLEKYPFAFSNLYTLIEKYTYRNSVGATPITQSSSTILYQKGFKKKRFVMNWGIDLDLFTKQNQINLKKKLQIENKFVIGYIGRFVKEKGLLDLLRSIMGLDKNTHVLLVGDGPLRDDIETLAEHLNLKSRLTILSSVSNSHIAQYLNCMDLLVLPSKDSQYWKEQFGKVLIEAMACEVPVLGSDSGEIPYVIDNPEMIFRAGDYNHLHQKINSIIFGDVNVNQSILRAKKRVHQVYSWQTIAKNLHNLYLELKQIQSIEA